MPFIFVFSIGPALEYQGMLSPFSLMIGKFFTHLTSLHFLADVYLVFSSDLILLFPTFIHFFFHTYPLFDIFFALSPTKSSSATKEGQPAARNGPFSGQGLGNQNTLFSRQGWSVCRLIFGAIKGGAEISRRFLLKGAT